MDVKSASQKAYQYAGPNLTLVGWMGFVGFPIYYITWTYLFPQPYESLALRVFCAILFLGVVVRDKFANPWKKHLHIYYQIVITLCLPFFFFYMLIMNDWSTIWLLSYMSAIFLHVLLVHVTWLLFAQGIFGVMLAIAMTWLSGDLVANSAFEWAYVPIFLFVYVFGSAFYVRNQNQHEGRVALTKTLGAGIAHEMRNPLATLSAAVDVFQSLIPKPDGKELTTYQISSSEAEQLLQTTEFAKNSIHSGREAIDLLLTSIDESEISCASFQYYSAKDVVENAIESFGYQQPHSKGRTSLSVSGDFDLLGSDVLLRYVLFNLLKNAYQHGLAGEQQLRIEVSIVPSEHENRLVVTDNGKGMPQEVVERIFDDFFSTGGQSNSGLGLPFCQKVVRAFEGNIRCESQLGQGTSFIITVPRVDSQTIKNLQQQVLGCKTVHLVSDDKSQINSLNKVARNIGISIETLDINALLGSQKIKSDLILIDSDSLELNQFRQLSTAPRLPNTVILSKHERAGIELLWGKYPRWSQASEFMLVNMLLGKLSGDTQEVRLLVSIGLMRVERSWWSMTTILCACLHRLSCKSRGLRLSRAIAVGKLS